MISWKHYKQNFALFTSLLIFNIGCLGLYAWYGLGVFLVLHTLGMLLMCFLPARLSLQAIIFSTPFFLVIPQISDTFSEWKLVLALFILKTFWDNRDKVKPVKVLRVLKQPSVNTFLIAVVLSCILSISYGQTAKQIIFYGLFLCFYFSIKLLRFDESEKLEIIRSLLLSIVTVIIIGIYQLVVFIKLPFELFWLTWDNTFIRPLFGNGFANVSFQSNSWFNNPQTLPSLRMFSTMPSSHAFGFASVVGIVATLYLYSKKVFHKGWYIFFGVITTLGVYFSSTRGVWLGVIAAGVGYLALRKTYKSMFLFPVVLLLCLFVASPLIDKGIYSLKYENYDPNSLRRAQSIFDAQESSNNGRLYAWKQALSTSISHPLGVGMGNFSSAVESRYQNFLNANDWNKKFNLPQKYITAHNLYLHVAAEISILALGIILFWLVKFLWSEWKQVHTPDTLVFTLLFICAYAFFDVTILNDRILLLLIPLCALLYESRGTTTNI